MTGAPPANPLRLSDVNLSVKPVDVLPALTQNLFRAQTGESSEREIRCQSGFAVRGFETSAHLIRCQDLGIDMLETRLLQLRHRISRNDFEKVATEVEEATRDPPVIVHVDWRKILERSQKDVELAVIDAVDRVFSESSDETIEHDSDLGIARSSLLVRSTAPRSPRA